MKINEINTTSYRIIMSVTTACVVVITLMAAMLFFNWEPTDKQKWVLMGIAGGLLTMMGYDVAQFIGKRWSDIDFAAAKNPAPKVDVGTADTVIATTTEATVDTEPARPTMPPALAAIKAHQENVAGNPATMSGVPVGAQVDGVGD